MGTAKILIRLGACPGWSEASLGAHSLCWFVMSRLLCLNLEHCMHSAHMSQSMTKPTKWPMYPVQIQNSLDIHPLWSALGWPLSVSNKIPWLFPDRILFFPDQNTVFLRPFSLLAADKWQIVFVYLPNSTIQKNKKFWGKNALINYYKLLTVSSERSQREKHQHFQTLKKWTKYLLQPKYF